MMENSIKCPTCGNAITISQSWLLTALAGGFHEMRGEKSHNLEFFKLKHGLSQNTPPSELQLPGYTRVTKGEFKLKYSADKIPE